MSNSSPAPVRQDHEGPPLTTCVTFKININHWARLQTQALVRKVGYTTLARHWMIKGALAEGIDLDALP